MIHSSILPHEVVWQGFEPIRNQGQIEIQAGEMTMVLRPLSATQAEIVRIISPNPDHYLDTRFTPGGKIRFVPVLEGWEILP